MSSRQDARVERAEAAARRAADELIESRAERDPRISESQGGGVISSMMGAVQHAKEAIVGKSNETAERVGESTKDDAAEKSKDTKESTTQKLGEYKDYCGEKAEAAKDMTTAEKARSKQKLGEYEDYAGEKAEEAKDTTAEKAREAEDYVSGKTEAAKQKSSETAQEAKKDMLAWSEEEATRQIRLHRPKVDPGKSEVGHGHATYERGKESKRGILGNLAGAIKEKLAGASKEGAAPMSEQRTRYQHESGGGGTGTDEEGAAAVRRAAELAAPAYDPIQDHHPYGNM